MSSGTRLCGIPEDVRSLLDERLRADSLDLPMLPEVASEVISLCSSDDADAAELCEVVHRDPTLAGHLLRVTNSPAYMPQTPIVSLQQAIARLGLVQLAEITMAVAVRGKVFSVAGPVGFVDYLWKHSVAAGCYAKEIARVCRANVETAFLCGLVHDVGKVIVMATLLDEDQGLAREVETWELHEAMESYHTRVGGRLVTAWKLPEEVREAVLYHHDFLAAEGDGRYAMITCLADQLAHLIVADADMSDPEILREEPVLEGLNLYRDDLERLFGMWEEVREKVAAIG